LLQRIHQAWVSIAAMRISPREAYPNLGCRDMELLCRRRAALDTQHSWKWLGEAERWRNLPHPEAASRFQTMGRGPMAMGPSTIEGDYRN